MARLVLFIFVFETTIISFCTSFVYITTEKYQAKSPEGHTLRDLNWVLANEHCKTEYNTSLAPPDNSSDLHQLLECLPVGKRIQIGLQKNKSNLHWEFVDGSKCPSTVMHEDGFKKCIEDWDKGEPNFKFDAEYCAELRQTGKVNDIICDAVPYVWTEGFICVQPANYSGSTNVQQYCSMKQNEKMYDVVKDIGLVILVLLLVFSLGSNIKAWYQHRKGYDNYKKTDIEEANDGESDEDEESDTDDGSSKKSHVGSQDHDIIVTNDGDYVP